MSRPRAAIATLCFGGLAAALTQTMIIPIQGRLPELLDSSPDATAWVVTITLLVAAVTMPVMGRVADMIGKRTVLLASAGFLLVGSLVCAVSDSLVVILVGRAIQGLAMAFIPIGIALMREILPPRQAASAIATMSATLGVGGAIGLPLAAWIVQVGDWHALFWLTAAVAVVVLLAMVALVPPVADARPARFDLLGAVGLGLGLTLLLLVISRAGQWGLLSLNTVATLLASAAVLAVWGAWELRTPEPLVDLRTTAARPVLLTNLAAVAIGMGMMAQAIVVPQLLQLPTDLSHGLGQTIVQTGLWMAPGGLMMLLLAPVSGRLMLGTGPRRTLMLGGLVLAAGYLLAIGLMGAPWQLAIATVVISAGVGIGYAAMPTLVLDEVPPHQAASAVGLNSLARSLGTTVAAALMGSVLTSSATGSPAYPTQSAFQVCFVLGAVAALIGVAIAATIPRRVQDPAPELTEPVLAPR